METLGRLNRRLKTLHAAGAIGDFSIIQLLVGPL